MKNFNYNIPTKIFFGEGKIEELGKNLKKYVHSVLLCYGGGSIKKTGIYDKVIKELNKYDIEYKELKGIAPNPRITSVREGVTICRKYNLEGILAVGGGSTIDCAKAIGGAYFYEGDPWDIVIDKTKIKDVLPIFSVLTLSATGSEMDGGAVISDITKNEKWGTAHEKMKPIFSILDPTFTYTVSKEQTAAGTADIMSHTLENYFCNDKGAFIQARFSEGILKTLIKYGPIAIKEPKNYEARANLMWASSLTINGLTSYGESISWSVHPMEHELSAFYDITHGVGLAILTPYWMEYVLNKDNLYKFKEYGENVWGISGKDDIEVAKEAIKKTREFFNLLGLPDSLSKVGIDEEHFDIMAKKAARPQMKDAFYPLSKEDCKNIYKMAL